jgi:hypothetical protein
MTETDERMRQEMTAAIESYDGPVTKYPPGRARGKPVRLKPLSRVLPKPKAEPKLDVKSEKKLLQVDGATRWLKRHANDQPADQKEARRQKRMARAKRQRIDERNAMIRKAHGLGRR